MVRLRGRGGGSASGGCRPPVSGAGERAPPRVELKENYPNPFFPATTIPFMIPRRSVRGGHQPVVSLKIYNVLVQVVAIPAKWAQRVGPERLDSLRLRCGEYQAHSGTGSIWTASGRRPRESTTTSSRSMASGSPGK